MRQSERICEICGTHFWRFNAWLRRSYSAGRFCSRKCQGRGHKRTGVTILSARCAHCGKLFQYRKGAGGTHETCSDPCRQKHHGTKCGGSKHPNWKGGITERKWSIKAAIKKAKRLRPFCELCGATENLHGHHRSKCSDFPLFADLVENVQVICEDCHAKEHPELAGWIKKAIKHKGALTKAAAQNGVSKSQEAQKESHSSNPHIRARGLLGKRFMSGDLHK